jgi:tetratricopeptide (TPR) repeat protein
MKKVLYILLSVLAYLPAHGQETGHGIAIANAKADITSEDLKISFDLRAEGLEIGSDDALTLEFAVEDSTHRLVLPVVAYSGNRRYLYEERRAKLSGDYPLPPYMVYKGVKSKEKYNLDYRISGPYYGWMEHAALTWYEYRHTCSGEVIVGNGVLVADLNPAPEVWVPDPSKFASLVSFLKPKVEQVKARAAMIELRIGFPVNSTKVLPDFSNNRHELVRADSLIEMLHSNELINIRSVGIRGYASPEGSYTANERLARGRSQSFKQYLVANYPANNYIRDAHTDWVPEDWEGFGRMVEQRDMAAKQDILAIVNDPEIAPDAKDKMLRNIPWWRDNRDYIQGIMFAALRRIELKVDYAVENLSDAQARELLYTDPSMLSLDEMYRVANYYEPGSRQYLEVYEIAARMFPDDFVANNNAAAALLQQGLGEQAYPYLQKMGMCKESYINLGAYFYVMGDLGEAVEYFNKAKDAGYEQGELNLQKLR